MTLSDTQCQILREAAQHEAGLAPLPKIPAAARNAVFRSMLRGGLLAELAALPEHVGRGWRQDEADAWIALRITNAGLTAIGLELVQTSQETDVAPVAPEAAQIEATACGSADSPGQGPEAASMPQAASPSRTTLRAAAAAVIAAWEASLPLEAPLTTLCGILAGRTARAPLAAGAPRKPREGTKQAAVLALLRRPEGATVPQVVEATGWAPHTVRGFFAGLRSRHGIEVTVLERVRQVGPNKTGARGSYSIYQIAVVAA
ncbi:MULTISPECIES: DUF3489 domain-containing protein [Roseomonadaceae]|uniref:DUF3489 domain-containing protein n=1 Tax=Falsiroseomonas oleicola TaxID=2801474 RepID=A0ABS6H6U4_9PROT|nr:DUF3489 domain-containing protein [Roseomonas oleicola]MBU8544413.1 DUF3489 domain-containing protein [Roseomonas oleicola]